MVTGAISEGSTPSKRTKQHGGYVERIKKLFKEFSSCECLKSGNSGDEKFVVEEQGNKYFVKFTKYYINPNLKEIMEKANVPHVKIIDVGAVDGYNYIIQEYFKSESLKDRLSILSKEEIRKIAKTLGKGYSELIKFFPNKQTTDEEYLKFIQFYNLLMGTYEEASKNLNKFAAENLEQLKQVKLYLETNIEKLKQCPLVFGHPDIHPGNFLFKENELVAIDYDTTNYAILAVSILWGILSDNILDMEKYLSFTSGYLQGLFDNNIEEGVITGINLIFAFITLRFVFKLLRKNEVDKAEQYIINTSKYFTNGKFDLKNRLTQT